MTLVEQLKKYKRIYSFYKTFCKPTFGDNYGSFRNAISYYENRLFPEYEDVIHLNSAMKWLERAHDVCNRKGISAMYLMDRGWDVAYPETSGYILSTFITYSDLYENPSFFKRAIEIGDWEIEIQTNCGGVLSNPTKTNIRVFNTGQVILGWCLLYERTQNEKYLEAACKGGDFLADTQENDGRWIQNTHCGARTYHARIDWALLRLFKLTGEIIYLNTAEKNLIWVLSQQNRNGWFENCGFEDNMPIMHVIAYTMRGLLECQSMNIDSINKLEILQKLTKPTKEINEFINKQPVRNTPGLIPTSFQNNWLTQDNHSCLTGNAQYAIYLYRLSQISNDSLYGEYADIIVSALKRTQKISVNKNEQNINGAIAGSYPINSGYCASSFPNWATKFFADAIMMKSNHKKGLIIKA